jgi:hypothetical protein
MISLDEYMDVTEAWDYMPGEDGCPFEPKASDWGWFEGRMVALDYSTPAWEPDPEAAFAAKKLAKPSNEQNVWIGKHKDGELPNVP